MKFIFPGGQNSSFLMCSGSFDVDCSALSGLMGAVQHMDFNLEAAGG